MNGNIVIIEKKNQSKNGIYENKREMFVLYAKTKI